MKQSPIAVGLLLSFLWWHPSTATSLRNVGPLADADDVSVEATLVGGTLAAQTNHATSLFALDFDRSARFGRAVEDALAKRLTSAGIPVRSSSKYAIGVSVFGGTFDELGSSKKVVVLIEVWIGSPGQDLSRVARTILAVVDGAAIESTVLSEALHALDEFIEQRASYREAKRSAECRLTPACSGLATLAADARR
ncbi:MAG: hypothetical protein IPP07_21705 [Holophagales bacterium]|nr:hypothetical protein [Holophagales bacterium]